MRDIKKFKILYDYLLKISEVDTCSCNPCRDDRLADLLIKFKTNLKGKLSKEEIQYIKDFPIINSINLPHIILKDDSLDIEDKIELIKNFKGSDLSKSQIRRLDIQLRRKDAIIRKG